MAVTLFTTSGARLFIGQVLNWQGVDFTVASFNPESWIEIPWLENLGDHGDSATEVNFDVIALRRTQKYKGTRNAGNMTVVMGLDHTSFGQASLLAAADDSVNDYAFKVTMNDASTGGQPSIRYFTAKVMSVVTNLQTANNVVRRTALIAITSNIVRVDAVP